MNWNKLLKIFIPIILLLFICILLLGLFNSLSKDRIADNKRRHQLPMLNALMPLEYNNDMFSDIIEVNAPGYFGTDEDVFVYRARKDNDPVGVVILPVVTNGYSGQIRLAVGIDLGGALLGAYVISHRETEGLGDGIDQDKSDWINQFTDRSLENTPPEGWAVINEGGQFDQLSGATISSRAVINAVRKSLDYYEINKDRLY